MVYLFFGDNSFEVERRLKELVATFDGDVEKIDGTELTVDQLPDLLAGVTLFSTKRVVVIKYASHNKPVWTALGEWCEKGVDNDIVLVETNPDKRTKTYKWLEKHAKSVQVKELQPFEAIRWAVETATAQGLMLPRDEAEFFVDYVGTDQWRLSAELEKLRLSGQPVTRELIRQVVEPTLQATSFELLDAAFRGDVAEVDGLFDIVSGQEDPYMFFGLLSGQVYAIAAVRAADGRGADVVAKDLGIHPFVVRKVSPLAKQLSLRDVKDLMGRLAELDANMKSRAVDPWIQVQSFLHSLQAK